MTMTVCAPTGRCRRRSNQTPIWPAPRRCVGGRTARIAKRRGGCIRGGSKRPSPVTQRLRQSLRGIWMRPMIRCTANRKVRAFPSTTGRTVSCRCPCSAANAWDRTRRVIVKAEHTDPCRNPRFVVTNLTGDAPSLYDDLYCAHGEMENRIQEQPLGLFADRTSCHGCCSAVWMETLRRIGWAGTELACAPCSTIRLQLLKIGAVRVRDTRRVRFLLASRYPHQELFATVGWGAWQAGSHYRCCPRHGKQQGLGVVSSLTTKSIATLSTKPLQHTKSLQTYCSARLMQ